MNFHSFEDEHILLSLLAERSSNFEALLRAYQIFQLMIMIGTIFFIYTMKFKNSNN